ncbi:sugar ABC transporter ATP-binding protein [Herbiconiux sp. CPCC 203407]|uniref:Sugar ABC transporter ATP-binding protein n=1 Tax=Herbiconiux oxytropis TaxID=2970915 RepID=A0AA41XHH2_9MICO|nr:sugar ABC transporter ATP-binding protein [Herbiconiux oxytropis]MCS5720637.1 sugar ABC transporter ATP-binding protein [Herbiconiux oxytropis]MCS5725036.1 sugar ABC transporter ATP-binding protein [Herbiconiux oxytropis]
MTGEGLLVDGISKSYGPTNALTDVSLAIRPGRVTALIGHNGAGKSTLLRSLSGAEVPDSGSIRIDGEAQSFTGPRDASTAGIACVYQELSLVDQLTVAQNIFLGQEQVSGGVLSRRQMNRRADELCAEYGITARATDLISSLPVAQRQMVEVARAINQKAKYILLDEPTTALEEQQVEHLLGIVRRLVDEQGIGVLLVDHKLDEVFAVADHVIGLSGGRIVLDGSVEDVDRAAVIEAIVGDHGSGPVDTAAVAAIVGDGLGETSLESVETVSEAARAREFGAPVLEATGLSGNNLHGVDLTVHAGEILGIYGLVGSGRTRFLRTVYGAFPLAEGSLKLLGKPFRPKSPAQAIKAGVAFLSEERKFDGFVPQMSSIENVVLPVLGKYIRGGVLRWRALKGSADDVLSQVSIRGQVSAPITSLSGGNQQKALFARATLQAPLLLLLDEPTKGVDIGAKREIYGIIRTLAAEKNVAVIVVSSEEEELTELADSIAVFRGGSCDGVVYPRSSVTAAQLRELAWADASPASAGPSAP